MSIQNFISLARLLVKYRAMFSVSRCLCDTIDLIVCHCLDHIEALGIEPHKFNDIPF